MMLLLALSSSLTCRAPQRSLSRLHSSPRELFAQAVHRLAAKNVRCVSYMHTCVHHAADARSDPEASARYLLADALQIDTRYSSFRRRIDSDAPATTAQTAVFAAHMERRMSFEPLQYIVGNWDFFGHVFACRAPVLIPRPETEELVERLLSSPILTGSDVRILDVGAGSGAIGISLLGALGPGARCLAVDVSQDAVRLSRDNAAAILGHRWGERYECRQCSWLDLATDPSQPRGCFDVIVSNPPYIPSAEMESLQEEVIRFEDRGALHGGIDGLDVVMQILRHARALLRPSGELWMEVSEAHPRTLRALFDDEETVRRTGLRLTDAMQDLSGRDRFVRLTVADS